MNIGKKRRGLRHSAAAPLQDAEDGFLRATCGEYMIRHLGRHSDLDEKTLEFLFWTSNEGTERMINLILDEVPVDMRMVYEAHANEAQGYHDELTQGRFYSSSCHIRYFSWPDLIKQSLNLNARAIRGSSSLADFELPTPGVQGRSRI
jgi:hypothetical protein